MFEFSFLPTGSNLGYLPLTREKENNLCLRIYLKLISSRSFFNTIVSFLYFSKWAVFNLGKRAAHFEKYHHEKYTDDTIVLKNPNNGKLIDANQQKHVSSIFVICIIRINIDLQCYTSRMCRYA